jgi:hypothetical protein
VTKSKGKRWRVIPGTRTPAPAPLAPKAPKAPKFAATPAPLVDPDTDRAIRAAEQEADRAFVATMKGIAPPESFAASLNSLFEVVGPVIAAGRRERAIDLTRQVATIREQAREFEREGRFNHADKALARAAKLERDVTAGRF